MEFRIFQDILNGRVPPDIQNRATLIAELRGISPWEPTNVRGYSLMRWQAVAAELMLLATI